MLLEWVFVLSNFPPCSRQDIIAVSFSQVSHRQLYCCQDRTCADALELNSFILWSYQYQVYHIFMNGCVHTWWYWYMGSFIC